MYIYINIYKVNPNLICDILVSWSAIVLVISYHCYHMITIIVITLVLFFLLKIIPWQIDMHVMSVI